MVTDSAHADEAAESSAAAAKQKGPSFAETLYSGWTEWVSKHRRSASLVIAGIIICIILVAVVPPVCVLHGCGAGQGSEEVEDDLTVKRLLVHFDELGKTVKSKVSPLLYEYFEEIVLSFGVNIVTFKTAKVLNEVQRILEGQPDVLILLRDRPQFQAPTVDPYLGVELRGPLSDLGRRRQLLQASGGAEPGDNMTDGQWSLEKVAARRAWNVSQGERVVVAVVDTGCDMEHSDLKANLWVNPREISGNGKDDDGNGFIDDVHGYDFAGLCSNVSSPNCSRLPNPQDQQGHGSHCGGIIGAVRNNGEGIVGVAPNVRLMCLKVTPNDGLFYTAKNLEAIDYAIKNGAHIISCSFGPVKPTENATEAQRKELRNETALYNLSMEAIKKKNMLLVAAAGNELTNLDSVDFYNPCTLVRDFPDNVLCVMATDDLDQRLTSDNGKQGSNYGPNTVSVGAPGLQILSTVPGNSWRNMSGSSMATPLVAGVAALILSILGSKDGNFFQGSTANAILKQSGVFVPNLAVSSKNRINASAAVEQALKRLTGVTGMVPQADFSVSDQSALMEGFNLTYYASTTPGSDPGSVVDESTMASRVPRFEGYKYNNGTLVVRASMNLSRSGLYLIRVNTKANPGDIRVFVGQTQLSNLSDTYLVESTGGWYRFELRYINPVAPVDISLAEPNSGGAPALGYLPSTFFISTDEPLRSFYYAPNIALSATWQVLTKEASEGPLRSASIHSPNLKLDMGYNNSAVLEALNFTSTSSPRLRDALRLPGTASSSSSRLVGVAHTRLRAPEGTSGALRFKITCELCALYVNGLRVADVYDPLRWLQPATQLTNCITLGAGGSAPLNDLVLRFAVGSAANGSLALGWLPCDVDGGGSAARPLGPYLMNNLFWQPSSGVAGYVAGMQCDVWRNRPGDSSPKDWLPLLKFRLPTALAHTANGVARNLSNLLTKSDPPSYDLFNFSQCNANETRAGSNCSDAFAFALPHILNRGEDFSAIPSPSMYMRCWTYVNAGFSNGTVQVLRPAEVNVYLGAQKVLESPSTNSIFNPSVAPNATALGNYYQLLLVEFPSIGFSAFNGICNGSTPPVAGSGASNGSSLGCSSDFLVVDMTRTLLPIPLISTSAGRNRRRLQSHHSHSHSGFQSDSADLNSNPGLNADPGLLLHELLTVPAEEGGAGRRGLQQQPQQQQADAASGNVFRPSYLGASPYATGIWPSNPGLCGLSFTPDGAYNNETLRLPTVLYNISLTAVAIRGTPCVNASAGLSEPVCFQQPNRTLARHVQAKGYLRVPAAAGGGSGGGAMRRWTLSVFDHPDQTSAFTLGDVTVRNGVEYPSNVVTASETVLFLPPGVGGGSDVFLPAVMTARSRVVGWSAIFNVALLAPDTRVVWRVNASLWYCS